MYSAFVTWGTLNSRRATSPLVRLVEERWRPPGKNDQPLGVLSQNWGGTELNRSVTCKVFKTTANDRRRLMSSNNPKLYEEFNIVEIT
ncbi:hypothetical protein TNCV_1465761 [Trichonephila clavipes]|nr:hypothetical protein TNCV_1465761 [Trichonephila clavipes]